VWFLYKLNVDGSIYVSVLQVIMNYLIVLNWILSLLRCPASTFKGIREITVLKITYKLSDCLSHYS
jgi:hypothetical protein